MDNCQLTKEDLFEHFMENSPVYVFFKNDQIRALQLSRNYEKMLGRPLQELLGKTMDDLFPSDLAKSMIADDKRILEEGKPKTVEEELNGRFYSTIKFPISIQGKPLYLAGYSIDITERKRAEEALHGFHRLLESTFSSLMDAIFILDSKAVVMDCNSAAANIFGYSREEMLGRSTDFLHVDHGSLENFRQHMASEMAEKGFLNLFEFMMKQKDGTVFPTEHSVTPLEDEKGRKTGWISVVRDITERKRIDEELTRTQKLESLGLLAGGIAHDFNNLMGGIFGYIDMAIETTKDAKVTSYLSKAMNAIDRARALTEQLLTFAKGGTPIQQIGKLFPFVEETARFALSGANVSCNCDVQEDLWACNFDKNQIGQVIDNLIINAQQAMPVGGAIGLTARNVLLSENEHPLLEKGSFVKISIKDSGIGIPKEMITKIFDPFFTTKAMGHGLGLATCYSIINRHGGCIDVESEPGKGSTFKVYLPAAMEAASTVTKNAPNDHKGSGTFLIMDDEELMRGTIEDMLESLGYRAISKENGKDAIDFFKTETKANRTFAGMIFDLTVPGSMGGKDAIEEIRKINTDIPCFVASGYADDPVMKNPTEYGFTASICKPFRRVELVEMLNKYMQKKK